MVVYTFKPSLESLVNRLQSAGVPPDSTDTNIQVVLTYSTLLGPESEQDLFQAMADAEYTLVSIA